MDPNEILSSIKGKKSTTASVSDPYAPDAIFSSIRPSSAPTKSAPSFSLSASGGGLSVPKTGGQTTSSTINPGEGSDPWGFIKDIFGGSNNTAGGVIRNTITGLPEASKKVASYLGNKAYDTAGGLVAPGVTHDELRDPAFLGNTALGLPGAIVDTVKQTVLHPIKSSQGFVGGIVRGISDQTTNIIANLTIRDPETRDATKQQIQETLNKYLTPPDSVYTTGSRQAGEIAPALISAEAGGALAGALKTSPIIGEALGFVGTGQASIDPEASIKDRGDQALGDLIGLGLFKVGSFAYEKAKVAIKDALTKSDTHYNSNPFDPPPPPPPPPHGGDVTYTYKQLENNIINDNSVGPMNYDRAIASGDFPAEAIYSDPKAKIFQPDRAQAMVDDVSANMNRYKPGLGDQLPSALDINNTSASEIKSKAIALIDAEHANLHESTIAPTALRTKIETKGVDNSNMGQDNTLQNKGISANGKTLDTGARIAEDAIAKGQPGETSADGLFVRNSDGKWKPKITTDSASSYNIKEVTIDGKSTGDSKTIIYRTTSSGKKEVDVYIKAPDSPSAGMGGSPEGHVWTETIPLEKAQQKFQTTDPQTLAERIVNPHKGYNYQTETYQAVKGAVSEAPSAKVETPTNPAQEAIAKTLRGTKGMTADQIQKQHPNIRLTKDVVAKDVYGNTVKIPDGEKLTPYEMKDGKIVLQDGQAYVVSKNQFANIKGNTVGGEAKPFAPELAGTEETVKGTNVNPEDTKGLDNTPVEAYKIRDRIDNLIKKLSNSEYDMTPKDGVDLLRTMFTSDEIKAIHGKDIGDWANLSDPEILKNLEGFYRPRSWGADLIGLVERDGKVSSHTVLHESLHAYLERFTSRSEKDALIKYVRDNKLLLKDGMYDKKAYSTPEARAEEWIADDFARYVKEKKADSALQPFYKRMLNQIREWIRKKGQLETLYNRILNRDRSVVNPKSRTLNIKSFNLRLKEDLPEHLDRQQLAIEFAQEGLDAHPASRLGKYVNGRGEWQGKLPEVTGKKGGSRFAQKGDSIISEHGYTDTEDARAGYGDYLDQKKRVLEMKRQYQADRVTYYAEKKASTLQVKDEDALNKMAERSQNLQTKEIYSAEKKASIKSALEETQKKLVNEQAYKQRFKDIVAEANRPSFKSDSLYSKLKQSLNPAKFLDKETFGYFKDWKRTHLVSREIANEQAMKFDIPKDEGMAVIHNYQAGKNTKYTEQIKKTFDSLYNEATSRGLDFAKRDNYLPQVYKETPAQIRDAMVTHLKEKGLDDQVIQDYIDGRKELPPELAKSLKLEPSFSKEKVFPSYAVAEKYGLHPKYSNPAQLAGYYRLEMEKTFANRDFMEKLSREGKILPAGLAPRNWQEVKLTLGGDRWFAPTELAKVINGQIHDANANGFFDSVVHTVAGLSQKAQEIALSAGIPNSSFNFFTIGQLVKNITAGDFKTVVPFLRSNFDGASIKYFENNIDTLKQMAGQGIDLGSRIGKFGDLYTSLSSKWKDSSFVHFAGETFDKLFNEKTFGSFMPQIYMQTFKDAMKQASKHGFTGAEAEKFAGDTTKAFYGLIEDNGRSLKTQDKLSALLFAPRFRESIINTILNAGKSISTEWKNPMFYKNRRLLVGMAITYAGYNLLNYKLNGNYMWNNENGKEASLKIPTANGDIIYLDFMPSFLSLPRNLYSGIVNVGKGDFKTAGQKFGQMFSMPIKITSEIIGNADYFGRPIYKDTDTTGTKTLKIAQYVGLSVNHPYVKEVINQVQNKYPLYQSISNALELPLKFSSMSKIEQNQYYDALDKIKVQRARDVEAFAPTFENIQGLIKAGKSDEAQQALDGLSDDQYGLYKSMKSSNTKKTTIKRQQSFLPTYNEIQALKSQGKLEEAQAKLDGLSDEEYKSYDQLRNKFAGASTDQINKGTPPQFEDGKKATDKGFISVISTYAKAIGTDPVTAFDRIFSGQAIRRVDNGTIIVDRMSKDASQEVKTARGGNNPAMKLDHTIPLEIGGSNDEGNLKLVPTDTWKSYTPVENALGKALRSNKITKKQAQDTITKFKNGEITAEEAIALTK